MLQKIFIMIFLLSSNVLADEIRPGYLELHELSINTFSVLWKLPIKNSKTLSLVPDFPDTCKNKTAIVSRPVKNALLQSWYIHCEKSIQGQRISVNGIVNSSTDVLLRFKWLDGGVSTTLLKPASPDYVVPEKSTSTDLAITYLMLGAEHILMGVDHLLFVFALLLLVRSLKKLVMTISAFTLAHSITLGAATLGLVNVPQQPVEAVIALSILFLAVELIHAQQGRIGAAEKWPWLIAFMFGLLHGFGFAGALAEIGLPQQAIPLTLIFFNIGVELGQLLFVLLIMLFSRVLFRLIHSDYIEKGRMTIIYIIGSVSAFWLIERISVF